MPKIIKIGDSLGVTINRHVLEFLGWEEGDLIIVEQGSDDSHIKLINIRLSSRNFKGADTDEIHEKH